MFNLDMKNPARMAKRNVLIVNVISTSFDGPFPGMDMVAIIARTKIMKLPFKACMYFIFIY